VLFQIVHSTACMLHLVLSVVATQIATVMYVSTCALPDCSLNCLYAAFSEQTCLFGEWLSCVVVIAVLLTPMMLQA